MAKYTANFTDYLQVPILVDWSEKLWNNHLSKHPEIKSHANTSSLIEAALTKPSLVLEGTRPGDSECILCYYKEHTRQGIDVYYTKVVVGCNQKPFYVKTIFKRWAVHDLAVQEKKYDFKEVYRDIKSCL